MSVSRQRTKMERALDRFISQLRSVDKVLWSYSGKNIEKEAYPLSSFSWIEDEIDEAHRLWMDFMEEKMGERDKVVILNNDLHPTKIDTPPTSDIDDKFLLDTISHMLTPKA